MLFVVYIGSIWSTVIFLRDVGHNVASENVFEGLVLAFVWFVVLFGNFAEALVEEAGEGSGRHLAQDPLGDRRPRGPARWHDGRRGLHEARRRRPLSSSKRAR